RAWVCRQGAAEVCCGRTAPRVDASRLRGQPGGKARADEACRRPCRGGRRDCDRRRCQPGDPRWRDVSRWPWEADPASTGTATVLRPHRRLGPFAVTQDIRALVEE